MMNSANQQPVRGSVIVPPPPTGSILQKQSSFSRGRNSTTSAQSPSATSATPHINTTTTASAATGSTTGANTMMGASPTHRTSSSMSPSVTTAAATTTTPSSSGNAPRVVGGRGGEGEGGAAHNATSTRDSISLKPTPMASVANNNTITGVNESAIAKEPYERNRTQPNNMMMNVKSNTYPPANNVRTSLDAASMDKSREPVVKTVSNQPQPYTMQEMQRVNSFNRVMRNNENIIGESAANLSGPRMGGVGAPVPPAANGMPFYGSMNDANVFGSMHGGFVNGNAAMNRPGSAMNGMGSYYGQMPNSSAYGNKLGSAYGSMGGNEFGSTLQQNLLQRGSMGSIVNNNNNSSNGSALAGPYGSGVFGGNTNNNSMMGMMPPQGSSMFGSMHGPMGSFYGPPNGSMYRLNSINRSLYGAPGSMYANGSMYDPYGSMYGMGGGSMYRPMGSMYGSAMLGMGPRMTSAYGFAAQWGSLSHGVNPTEPEGNGSAYGSFSRKKSSIRFDQICPVIGDASTMPELKRSGRRGGNHLYAHDKNDKSAVVATNSQSVAMAIKRRRINNDETEKNADSKEAESTSTRTSPQNAVSATAHNKPRAKVPTTYDLHTLLVIDKTSTSSSPAVIKVIDANTLKYEKDGKNDKFDCDEVIERESSSEEVDSVLLSELRGNWLSGRNSSLLVAAGANKVKASEQIVRSFVEKTVQRVSSDKDSSSKFDVTINMVAIRGSDMGCDLLKKTDRGKSADNDNNNRSTSGKSTADAEYKKLKLGSSPVYGPCLLDLTNKVVTSAKKCVEVLDDGLKAATASDETVVAFLVLKEYKTGDEKSMHISSLCISYFREKLGGLIDLKEKASSSPHRLFRYAVGGASVTVSLLVMADNDPKAYSSLEVERKMRQVKNSPPRSGNLKRFIDFTEKEVVRQKEKLDGLSGSEKKSRESQITRLEEMVKDAQEMFNHPEKTQPKGYALSA